MPKTQGRCKVPPCMSHEWAIFSKRNRIAFNAVSHEKLTNDGLIRCSDMVGFEQDEPKYLWFRDEQSVVAYPNEYCSSIFKYICENEYLSKFSALRMVSGQGIFGRACMFGVPFERSLLNVIDQGFVKAEYYLPDQQDNVYYASLLFHLNRRKESNRSAIELQVWQYCPGLSEVFYIHAESNDFLNYITHLDGAIIHFHPDDVRRLFILCDKIKGIEYEKQFRFDGKIPTKDAIKIISEYLPVEELVDEAFEINIG